MSQKVKEWLERYFFTKDQTEYLLQIFDQHNICELSDVYLLTEEDLLELNLSLPLRRKLLFLIRRQKTQDCT